MPMTLAELLALLPDNTTGDIGADDMRTITTELYNQPAGGGVAVDPIWDTKGDLAVATAADVAVKLPVGTDTQVLTVDSTQAAGVKWATPTGGGTAAGTTFTPTGSLSSTNVQAALAELDGDVTSLPTLTTSDLIKVPISTTAGVTTLNVGKLISDTTLVSSDTAKLTVTTASGITTLDVTNVAGVDMSDAAFRVSDNTDATKKLALEVSSIPTATVRTLALPAMTANDTLVTVAAAQTLTGKTLTAPIITAVNPGSPSQGITVRADADTTSLNDFSRSNMIELFGNLTVNPRLVFMHQGGSSTAPAQTTTGTVLQLAARSYTGTAYTSNNVIAINAIAEEAVTTSARGTRLVFSVTPLGQATALEALRMNTDTVPATVHRGSIVAGAGATMASPAAGYGIECKAGAIGYGVGVGGTATQGTSRTTPVTCNFLCGHITMFSAAGAAAWSAFTVNNSTVAAGDIVYVCCKTATNTYVTKVTQVAAGSFTVAFSAVTGTATDAPVLGYMVFKIATT